MADGRHFENNYISISQPQSIRISRNLVRRHKFYPMRWKRDKKIRNSQIQDGGRTPYLKSNKTQLYVVYVLVGLIVIYDICSDDGTWRISRSVGYVCDGGQWNWRRSSGSVFRRGFSLHFYIVQLKSVNTPSCIYFPVSKALTFYPGIIHRTILYR